MPFLEVGRVINASAISTRPHMIINIPVGSVAIKIEILSATERYNYNNDIRSGSVDESWFFRFSCLFSSLIVSECNLC